MTSLLKYRKLWLYSRATKHVQISALHINVLLKIHLHIEGRLAPVHTNKNSFACRFASSEATATDTQSRQYVHSPWQLKPTWNNQDEKGERRTIFRTFGLRISGRRLQSYLLSANLIRFEHQAIKIQRFQSSNRFECSHLECNFFQMLLRFKLQPLQMLRLLQLESVSR